MLSPNQTKKFGGAAKKVMSGKQKSIIGLLIDKVALFVTEKGLKNPRNKKPFKKAQKKTPFIRMGSLKYLMNF